MGYKTYVSKETVRARKVTADDGETVVTQQGPRHVPKGDYVVDDGRVFECDHFEAQFKARTVVKKTTSAKTVESTRSVADAARAADKKTSAAERVRAARAAKKA